MTWIKNSFKLLVLSFAVVCVATTQINALSISEVNDFACEGNDSYTYKLQYVGNFTNVFVRNFAASSSDKYDVLLSFNSSKQPYRCFYNALNSQNPAFMGYYRRRDGYLDLRNYDINYNLLESDIPFSGVLGDFSGYYVPLTNIWLANNNYVLYNDDLTHTLQYIGNYKVRDYILWVDPLNITYDNPSYDNFYLISIPKRKAWSMKLTGSIIQDIFYGNLDSYDFKTFNYTNSYSLLQTTNTTIFPKQSVYMNNTRSYLPNDIGFTYSKDLNFVSPDFGDNIETNTDTNYFNVQLVNYYNSCVNKGENLRKALQLATYCKLQGELAWENIIINTGLNYTGSYSYCTELDQFIVNAYGLYSGNWNNGIINENVDLQDNSAPFNDLIFSWYYNSLVIDSNHNLSGLPNGNSWCSAFTVSQFYDNEKSTIEKISESISDFFGHDIAEIYDNTIGSHTTFSGLVVSLSAGTSGFFDFYLFDPYTEQFNSGYNAFHSDLGVNSCNDINSSFANMPFGNTALYVVSALLIFILLMFL